MSSRPSMTRQHFEAIAGAIATMQGANLRERTAHALIPALRQFNHSFNEQRFISVCTGARSLRSRFRRVVPSVLDESEPPIAQEFASITQDELTMETIQRLLNR